MPVAAPPCSSSNHENHGTKNRNGVRGYDRGGSRGPRDYSKPLGWSSRTVSRGADVGTLAARFPGFDNPSGELIELGVDGRRRSSRTVLGVLYDGDLYVPLVQAQSKWWPEQALRHSDVIVHHRGHLYPRRATRVTDLPMISRLHQQIAGAEILAATPEMFADKRE
jgi:hypothetical protein